MSQKTYMISQERVNKFASLTGGEARIHTDPEYANNTSFGSTLVQGMFIVYLVEYEFSKRKPNWKGLLDIKFLKPIRTNEEFIIKFRNINDKKVNFSIILTKNKVEASSGYLYI